MKRKAPAWLMLMLLSALAGLLLSVTNGVTAPVIERQSLAAADESRSAVFPGASSFRALALSENAAVDSCYEALENDAVIGHVGTVTVKGYGGDIEITVGLDPNFVITGISVGGDDFSESPGLGARTRDAEFTSQFVAVSAPVTLGNEIDSVTGASISSGAVVSGVNKIVKYIENLGKDASEVDLYHNAVDDSYTELPGDGSIDSAFRSESGQFAVFVSAKGFHGDIHAVVLLDAAGTITRVAIDETNFNETAGLGERVLEEGFLKQFIGLNGVIGVAPGGYGAGDADATSGATSAAGENPDATSGATATTPADPDAASSATSAAGETPDAMSGATATTPEGPDAASGATSAAGETPDAASGATATTPEDPDAASGATSAAGETPDAASGATSATGENPDATSGTTATTPEDPDAASSATSATGESSDATSSASVVIEKIEGANADVDGVSGATYSSAAVAKAVNAALAFVRGYLDTVA